MLAWNSKRLLIGLSVLVALLVAANIIFRPPQRYDVRIVTPPSIIASLPHWVAEERDMYRNAGLRVATIPVTASDLMVLALLNDDADVLPAVSLVDVVNASARKPVKPLIYSHSRMRNDPPFEALTVMAASTISSLRELQGQSIAVYPGVTSAAAVRYFLSQEGVDVSSIDFAPLPPPEHMMALQRGDVAASHIYEPQLHSNLEGMKVRLLTQSVYASLTPPESAIGVSAMSSKFYIENRDAAERFLAVWDEAVDFIREHDVEAREILMSRLGLSREVAMKATWVDVTKVAETRYEVVENTANMFKAIGVIGPAAELDASFFLPEQEK